MRAKSETARERREGEKRGRERRERDTHTRERERHTQTDRQRYKERERERNSHLDRIFIQKNDFRESVCDRMCINRSIKRESTRIPMENELFERLFEAPQVLEFVEVRDRVGGEREIEKVRTTLVEIFELRESGNLTVVETDGYHLREGKGMCDWVVRGRGREGEGERERGRGGEREGERDRECGGERGRERENLPLDSFSGWFVRERLQTLCCQTWLRSHRLP